MMNKYGSKILGLLVFLFSSIGLLTWSAGIHAQMITEYSFEKIDSFDQRLNAITIVGTERDAMGETTLFLYNFYNNPAARCMDFIVQMMKEPGEFYLNLSVQLRDNPSVFSRDDPDVVRGCGLEVRPVPSVL